MISCRDEQILINYLLKKSSCSQLRAIKIWVNLTHFREEKQRNRNWNSETKGEDIVSFTQSPMVGTISTLSFNTGTRTTISYDSNLNIMLGYIPRQIIFFLRLLHECSYWIGETEKVRKTL